jgi:hypothetical protein
VTTVYKSGDAPSPSPSANGFGATSNLRVCFQSPGSCERDAERDGEPLAVNSKLKIEPAKFLFT